MTLSEVCKVINTQEKYLSQEGLEAVIRIDELAAELVEKMGATTAQEIVDLIGPGWEYEFFNLLEEYSKARK